MAAIHQQIDAAERHVAQLERHAVRRERFMDAIDWHMMSGRDCLEADWRDAIAEEDLAAAYMEVEHLHGMEILGFSSRYDQVPFDAGMPFCMGSALSH